MPIKIITGDITEQNVDVIVNSASPTMYANHGVSGAIHKAAGWKLKEECQIIGHVDAGNAALTAGYKLKAPYIIHAVAPQWFGGHNREEEVLEKCYHNIYGIVEMEGFKSIAIPAIGIGTYHWPIELATPIAIRISKQYEAGLDIRFVCYSEEITTTYEAILKQAEII